MEASRSEQVPRAAGPDSGGESLPKHTMIGEFEIVDIIGEGGFGTVYLAIDHSLQRRVALKEYRPALLATRHGKSVMVRSQRHADAFEAGLKSFMNEARTLARFDHPALIHVYRVWQQNNTAYMAMPLCEGKSLTTVIRENPGIATQGWVTSMIMPLLDAVSTLHSSNIYHRDIAPDNVLIQETGQPMLLDFGAARQIATDRTQALTVILKPGYAPIEQFADDSSMRQGPWTDIYALGAVMYFSITGRAPPNAVARLAGDSIALLTDNVGQGYSTDFLHAIDKALAVRPHERPQSIGEFRAMLEQVSASSALTASVAQNKEPPPAAPAPVRNSAAELRREPMQKRVPVSSVLPQSPAPPIDPASARLKRTSAAAAAGASTRAKAISARLAPVVRTRRGLQIAGATAAVIILLLAMTLVSNPFAPRRATEAESASASHIPPTIVTAPIVSPAVTSVAPNGVAKAVAEPPPVTSGTVAVTTSTNSGASDAGGAVSAGGAVGSSGINGTVSLAVRPWGEVFVDGASKGASPPLKRLTLPEGNYKLEVTNPGFPSFTTDVQITRNKSTTISHQFK